MAIREDSSSDLGQARYEAKLRQKLIYGSADANIGTNNGTSVGTTSADDSNAAGNQPTTEPAIDATDEEMDRQVCGLLRNGISRLLQSYAVFFDAAKGIHETNKLFSEAEARILSLNRLERTQTGESVLPGNIEARLDNFRAHNQLVELKSAIAEPARVLGKEVAEFLNFLTPLGIDPDNPETGSVELRALRKQCDVVAAQLRGAIESATSELAPLPQRSEKEDARIASRKSKVEALKTLMIEAFDAHQQVKLAYDQIEQIWRASRHGYERVVEPRKPSAEEVLQFIENWTAYKVESLEQQRQAYTALAEYNRAMAVRRKASLQIKEILYKVPASAKMADLEERAIVRETEAVRDFLNGDDDLKLGRYAKIQRHEPPVTEVKKPEKEKELVETLREECQMLAYCVGARNFAQSDLYNANHAPEPVAPEPGDYDSGDGYASALRAYRKACADRRSVIWRKESVVEARKIQLEAVVARLAVTVDKCLRLSEATDELLVPFLVGDRFVSLFKKREERPEYD